MPPSPRVFISYAHAEGQTEAVRRLADRLREHGVDAWIDQYEQAPPAGWRAWMEEQLREADFVLVVASELYRRRVESSGPMDAGLGVRYESMLILDALYEAGMWNVRYVPVVLRREDRQHVPAPLRSYQRFSIYRDEGFERLLRLLTGQPAVVAPPLGEVPDLSPEPPPSEGEEAPPPDDRRNPTSRPTPCPRRSRSGSTDAPAGSPSWCSSTPRNGWSS